MKQTFRAQETESKMNTTYKHHWPCTALFLSLMAALILTPLPAAAEGKGGAAPQTIKSGAAKRPMQALTRTAKKRGKKTTGGNGAAGGKNAAKKKKAAGAAKNVPSSAAPGAHAGKRSPHFPLITNPRYRGAVLTRRKGCIEGPSGRETHYNFNMAQKVRDMKRYGYAATDYWVRADGCKMLGKYIMVAANYRTHPRGSLVATSLGPGIVCDTGGFARRNPQMIDIATTW